MAAVLEEMVRDFAWCTGCGCICYFLPHHVGEVRKLRKDKMARYHASCTANRRFEHPPVPVVAAVNSFSRPSKADAQWAKLPELWEKAGLLAVA